MVTRRRAATSSRVHGKAIGANDASDRIDVLKDGLTDGFGLFVNFPEHVRSEAAGCGVSLRHGSSSCLHLSTNEHKRVIDMNINNH